jgi:hypothetical protein
VGKTVVAQNIKNGSFFKKTHFCNFPICGACNAIVFCYFGERTFWLLRIPTPGKNSGVIYVLHLPAQ